MDKQNLRLTKIDKSGWAAICDDLTDLPVFMRAVWLDAVCMNWFVNVLFSNDNQIMGAIVFQQGKKFVIQTIMNPHMTPYHGLWINEVEFKHKKENKTIFKLISSLLVDSLPKAGYINLRLAPSVRDVQEFKWRGYDAHVRYTYKILSSTNLQELWTSLDYKRRNAIVKARKDLDVEISSDVKQHYKVVQETFIRAKEFHPVKEETYRAMYEGLKKSGNAEIFCAKDKDQKVHASLLLVWDHSTAYMISHGTIGNAHRGATSLLIWNAIEFAIQKKLDLDFEGSDIKRIESFYRDFGGDLTPYFQVVKVKNQLLRALFYTFKKL